MIERDRAVADPLSEDPDLAWHAYAVEYGARVRDQGLRVVATDLPLTHNSMTVNLDRLAEAHARVASSIPATCRCRPPAASFASPGSVRAGGRCFAVAAGRPRGLRESVLAVRLARQAGVRASDVALADIRLDIDDALELLAAPSLEVVTSTPFPARRTCGRSTASAGVGAPCRPARGRGPGAHGSHRASGRRGTPADRRGPGHDGAAGSGAAGYAAPRRHRAGHRRLGAVPPRGSPPPVDVAGAPQRRLRAPAARGPRHRRRRVRRPRRLTGPT